MRLNELKQAIYAKFNVSNTEQLKNNGAFQLATDGFGNLNYAKKETWKQLYRKLIGVIPDETKEQGYGCINGIDIFKYFRPWDVFELNPKTATKEDIKSAYKRLSKQYHPDCGGDKEIFNRIYTMYQSLVAEG